MNCLQPIHKIKWHSIVHDWQRWLHAKPAGTSFLWKALIHLGYSNQGQIACLCVRDRKKKSKQSRPSVSGVRLFLFKYIVSFFNSFGQEWNHNIAWTRRFVWVFLQPTDVKRVHEIWSLWTALHLGLLNLCTAHQIKRITSVTTLRNSTSLWMSVCLCTNKSSSDWI